MSPNNTDNVFAGILGEQYQTLKLICPIITTMSQLVATTVQTYSQQQSTTKLNIVELGGGTGLTTVAILLSQVNGVITSIDSAAAMQQQAQQNLQTWEQEQRLFFIQQDILTALQAMPDNSVDVIASAYTLHNFVNTYRIEVLHECYRVLKSGGQFINGDRYALDDINAHTQAIQIEAENYFKILITAKKLDILQQWILHLFVDESENHVMRESLAINQLQQAGFTNINLSDRIAVNALVTAIKA